MWVSVNLTRNKLVDVLNGQTTLNVGDGKILEFTYDKATDSIRAFDRQTKLTYPTKVADDNRIRCAFSFEERWTSCC